MMNRTAASTAVKSRTETFNGREHIVLPVVALVEGVIQAMNAGAPEFVAAAEFSKAPAGWNGRPIFVDHPIVNGVPVFGNQPSILEKRQVGVVFNAAAGKGKLTMEAWIDVERAREISPVLLDRINAGDPIEVSVGLMCDMADTQGEYHGKKYTGAWTDLIPDHLALLSKGHTGACSREMGCGVRAAQARAAVIKHEGEKWVLYSHAGKKLGSFDSEEQAKKRERQISYFKKDAMRIDKTFGGFFARMMDTFRGAQPSRDMTSGDLLRRLTDAIRAVDPTLTYVETYLPVKNPNRVIYMCYHPAATEYAAMNEVVPAATKLYERSFSLAADGTVSLGEEAKEVEPVMYYEPVMKAAACCDECAQDEAMRDAIGNGCNQYGCPDGAGGGGGDDDGGDGHPDDAGDSAHIKSNFPGAKSVTFGDDETITVKTKDGKTYKMEIGSDDDAYEFVNVKNPKDKVRVEFPPMDDGSDDEGGSPKEKAKADKLIKKFNKSTGNFADNIGEMDADDIASQYGLSKSQAKRVYKHVQKARYGALREALRDSVDKFVS